VQSHRRRCGNPGRRDRNALPSAGTALRRADGPATPPTSEHRVEGPHGERPRGRVVGRARSRCNATARTRRSRTERGLCRLHRPHGRRKKSVTRRHPVTNYGLAGGTAGATRVGVCCRLTTHRHSEGDREVLCSFGSRHRQPAVYGPDVHRSGTDLHALAGSSSGQPPGDRIPQERLHSRRVDHEYPATPITSRSTYSRRSRRRATRRSQNPPIVTTYGQDYTHQASSGGLSRARADYVSSARKGNSSSHTTTRRQAHVLRRRRPAWVRVGRQAVVLVHVQAGGALTARRARRTSFSPGTAAYKNGRSVPRRWPNAQRARRDVGISALHRFPGAQAETPSAAGAPGDYSIQAEFGVRPRQQERRRRGRGECSGNYVGRGITRTRISQELETCSRARGTRHDPDVRRTGSRRPDQHGFGRRRVTRRFRRGNRPQATAASPMATRPIRTLASSRTRSTTSERVVLGAC